MIALLAACQAPSDQISFSLENQEFVMMGPLFSGANMAQIEVAPEVQSFLETKGYQTLTGARLTAVSLHIADTLTFDLCEEMSLQAVGDATEMQQIAVLNPVPQGQTDVSLQPAAEAELLPYFQEGTFFLVLDANLAGDLATDLAIGADLTFELSASK
ncbi:MAG: hypothetical protein D6722_21930 [Bacteroidetes bacterium]|nr:MAG: hypothetical protein D6722_21930 [Bacteroidota bacterium]